MTDHWAGLFEFHDLLADPPKTSYPGVPEVYELVEEDISFDHAGANIKNGWSVLEETFSCKPKFETDLSCMAALLHIQGQAA